MKRILLSLLIFITVNVYAQQKGISYQAVILNPKKTSEKGSDASNPPLANKDICMLFEIVDGGMVVEYQESVQTKTNQFGMVNLTIGDGNITGGYASSFSKINWALGNKRLVVKLNAAGACSSYTEISNQPFMYVPYALYAENSTVSDGSITTAKLADGAVKLAKLASIPTASFLGRSSSGTGAPEVLTVSTAKTLLALTKADVKLTNVDNTSDINKPISKATQLGLDGKLDKVLKVPETIVTTPTKTLAIKGLEVSSSAQNEVVTIDPVTGVLSRSNIVAKTQQNVVDYKAVEGQLLFTTPNSISTINKVSVYRNGIRINATVVNANTIKLEPGAKCNLNDEVKIIQLN